MVGPVQGWGGLQSPLRRGIPPPPPREDVFLSPTALGVVTTQRLDLDLQPLGLFFSWCLPGTLW